jgi:hypothetical protein
LGIIIGVILIRRIPSFIFLELRILFLKIKINFFLGIRMMIKRLIDSVLKIILFLSFEKIKECLVFSNLITVPICFACRLAHNGIIPIIKNKKHNMKIIYRILSKMSLLTFIQL